MLNYKRIYLLLSSLIFSTYGFTLFDEIELTWTFPTDAQISFKLSVPLSLLEEDEFNWAFFGFKAPVSTPVANGTDIMLVNFTANTIEDRVSEMHFPLLDKDLGGTDDLILKSIEIEGANKNYLWSRDFLSLDAKDINFIAGKQYNLIWACGSYYQNWKPKIIKSGNTVISFDNGRRLSDFLNEQAENYIKNDQIASSLNAGIRDDSDENQKMNRFLTKNEKLSSPSFRKLQEYLPMSNGTLPPPQNDWNSINHPPPKHNGNGAPQNQNCSESSSQNITSNNPSQNCPQNNTSQTGSNDQNQNNTTSTNSSSSSNSTSGGSNNQTNTWKLNPLLDDSICICISLISLSLFL